MSISPNGRFPFPDCILSLLEELSGFPAKLRDRHADGIASADGVFVIKTWQEFSWHMSNHRKRPVPPEYPHIKLVSVDLPVDPDDTRIRDLYTAQSGNPFPGDWEGMQRYIHAPSGRWSLSDPLFDIVSEKTEKLASTCRGFLEKSYGKESLYWDHDPNACIRRQVSPQVTRSRRQLLTHNLEQALFNTIVTHGILGPDIPHPYAKVLAVLRRGLIPAGWSGDFYTGQVGVLDIWSRTLAESSTPRDTQVSPLPPPGPNAGILLAPAESQVFGRAVENHRRHLMPYALIPGRLIAPDITDWVPWVIPYEPEDGQIGEAREAHCKGFLQPNWLSFRLADGKLILDGSFRFFAAEPEAGEEEADSDLESHVQNLERRFQDLCTRGRSHRPEAAPDGSWVLLGEPRERLFTQIGGPAPGGNWVDTAPAALRVAETSHGPAPHDRDGSPFDLIGLVDHQLLACRMLGFINRKRDRVLFTFDWT